MMIEDNSIWYHLKTGGLYKILAADAKYEDQGPDSRAVVYQSIHGGLVWIRNYHEFMDGRFIRLGELAQDYKSLVEFRDAAFEAHPNIDLDIERLTR